MTQAVESYGGVVRSYMGDGIAAFFGIAGAREDDAIRAGLAALKILEVIAAYTTEIETAWGIPGVQVRVGVNSGRVATGMVGAADPHHVALGDAVNVAARLQGHAKPGWAVVGPTTAALLASRFELDRLGPLEIRGRTQPVESWRLRRYLGEPAGVHLTGFVGRQTELDSIDRVAERLRLGQGQIVVVTGDPGIGKSRLITECRTRTAKGLQWFSGRCSFHEVLRPYGPFIDMLRAWLEIDVDTPEVVARVRLLARLRESLGSDATTVLPLLSQLLAVARAELGWNADSPANEQHAAAIRVAYASWIAALAQRQPVVLALDDVDRADVSTQLLLQELFRLTTSLPVLLVLSMRDDPDTPGWAARLDALNRHPRRTLELRLSPLDDEDAEEFIALHDPDELLPASTRLTLRIRADGNPLYLDELTRTAIEAVKQDPSNVEPERVLALPAALEGLLLARIDRIPARGRSVLQTAAVIGRRFPKWILEVTGNPIGLEEVLETLIREGLIQEDGLTPSRYFAFRHALYQEAVITTLMPARRRELHELVAKAIESASPDQHREEIASHYLASGNERKAIEHLEVAARRAASLSSLTEAAELIDDARALRAAREDVSTLARLARFAAELARSMGRYSDALTLWREALDLAVDEEERSRTLLEVGRTEFELGETSTASILLTEVLTTAANMTTRSEALLTLCAIAVRQPRLTEAHALLSEIDNLPEALPVRAEVQRLSLWAGYHLNSGHIQEAERYAAETARVASGSGELDLELRAKRDLGIIKFVKGDLRDGADILREVCDVALTNGHVSRAQEAIGNLLVPYHLMGRLREGLEAGVSALEWIDSPMWRAVVLENVAEIEFEMCDPIASTHFEESMTICGEEGEYATGVVARLGLARIAYEQGSRTEAILDAQSIERSTAVGGVKVKVLTTLAEFLLRCDGVPDALLYLERAREMAAFDETEAPKLLRLNGLALVLQGNSTAGLSMLDEAVDRARSMAMELETGRSLVARGVAGTDTWRSFHRARQIFAACGSERGLAEVRRAVAGSYV